MHTRKPLLGLLIAVVAVFSVYAATQIYFPGVDPDGQPIAPSGMEKVLDTLSNPNNINTNQLGGVSATDYLRNTTCTGTQTWTGVDVNGKAVCGDRTPMLVKLNLTEGTATISGATRNAPYTFTVTGATPIETLAGNQATLQFADDYSILRLDQNTKIILQSEGNGSAIAKATLENGVLWGRVLTGSGVDFGNGSVVVGVRGTSLAMTRDDTHPQNTHITIVDSRQSAGNIAKLYSTDHIALAAINNVSSSITTRTRITTDNDKTVYIRKSSTEYETYTFGVSVKSALSPSSSAGVNTQDSARISKLSDIVQSVRTIDNNASYYYGDNSVNDWIIKNTKDDIAYMNSLAQSTGFEGIGNHDAIRQEITATEPRASTEPKAQLLCGAQVFWKGMTTPDTVCQDANVVAYFDCGSGDNNLSIKNADGTIGTAIYTPVSGVSCGGNYFLSSNQAAMLSGATVTAQSVGFSGSDKQTIVNVQDKFRYSWVAVFGTPQLNTALSSTFPNIPGNQFQIGYLPGENQNLKKATSITFTK